ncbi:MAG: Gfo/Idh/MocA family oxidoreductase [Rhodanobacteraceae bacterium]|nr:Gfo/Idh/MocA family oxidoreductase [Rhodanobacteraceae bacterium]
MTRRPLLLVGLGKIAHDQHLPCLHQSPAFELIAVASPGACLSGVPIYADLDAALDAQPAVQAVALCTPPGVRTVLAQRALQRGCHVLLEKPPGVQTTEVDALSRLARDHGLCLFAAWHSRFAAAVEPARAWLRQRDVGAVRVSWKEDYRVWHPGQSWLWQGAGFGVLDPGINALSILTRILPSPLRFIAAELHCPRDSLMPLDARIELASAAATIELELDFLHEGPPCWDIAIATDAGELKLGDGGASLVINGVPQPLPAQQEYPAIYARFAELIDTGQQDADTSPLALACAALEFGQRRQRPVCVLDRQQTVTA